MKTTHKYSINFIGLLSLLLICSCSGDEEIRIEENKEVPDETLIDPEKLFKIFQDKSKTPPLVTIGDEFDFVEAYSLLSTYDTIGESFKLANFVDGAGFLKDENGYRYIVNCESSYAVARVFLDEYLTPIKGDYLLTRSNIEYAKQCSATMWEASIHGGSKDIFLSASEAINFDVKGIDPWVEDPTPNADFGLDALGEFSWENAVPLPKDVYPGKTVILGGDDDSTDSEGQVVLYYSENGDDDLKNGKVYVLKTKEISNGNGGVQIARNDQIYTEAYFDYGVTYKIEFVEIENAGSLTKDEMEIECKNVLATHFMRVEDLDYRKGSNEDSRNIYFAVTGNGPGQGSYNDWGTIYKLELDENSPLSGTLTQIVSGNTDSNNMDGNLAELQSPDNICVTENFIYIQEDPNSFSRGHGAYIYQSDLNGNNIKKVLELNPNSNGDFKGEFGSLIDISTKVQIPGTFILAVQPKREIGSQIILLKGLPR
ncbi:hypothetical protein [Christiangramia aquimixticola]|uniref:hypothetical protein n=1 Tax=Christiangramia aquimixticola TaxID=1697558 RepID=UPI003AA89FD9